MSAQMAAASAEFEASRLAALATARREKADALQQLESALNARFACERDAALDAQAEAAMQDKTDAERAVETRTRADAEAAVSDGSLTPSVAVDQLLDRLGS